MTFEYIELLANSLNFHILFTKIVEEGFLELINNILTVGQVPALFADDEKDAIVTSCRTAAEEAGYSASK